MPRDNGERLNVNLRQSIGAARTLSFATASISNQMGGAAGAAGLLAENIARASRNAKIAASATGIGAVIAILATVVSFTVSWKEKTKEVADRVRDVQTETAKLNAQARGDKRLERELEIADTYTRETEEAKKLESIFRKFPDLQAAIAAKAAAARRAAVSEVARTFSQAQFEDFAALGSINLGLTGTATERIRNQRTFEISAARKRRIQDIEGKGFDETQVKDRMQRIDELFDAETRQLEDELAQMAQRVGDTFTQSLAQSIADGIAKAISSGSIGDGLKALTGGMLIGLGEMMQTIGTESLVAAKLFSAIITALRSFAPEGAIGPALSLIALGGLLKGLGASMGGSDRSRSNVSGSGSSGVRTTFVGTIYPGGGPTAAGIAPVQPITVNATFIGARDPRVQRDLLELLRNANLRGAV